MYRQREVFIQIQNVFHRCSRRISLGFLVALMLAGTQIQAEAGEMIAGFGAPVSETVPDAEDAFQDQERGSAGRTFGEPAQTGEQTQNGSQADATAMDGSGVQAGDLQNAGSVQAGAAGESGSSSQSAASGQSGSENAAAATGSTQKNGEDVSWAGGSSIAGGGAGLGQNTNDQSKFTAAPFDLDIIFDDKTETLTKEDTKDWRKKSPAGQYVWNHDAVYAYLQTLKDKYDTPVGEVEFTTHDGIHHTFHSDNCGWQMNLDMSAQQLEACADYGEKTMDPVWNSGCTYSSKNGVGPKYVEISIDEQKVFLYEWGELIFETDCVTGTKDYTDTDTGVYQVIYTASPSVLKDVDPNGYAYEQPVNYWIPFNGSQGMHDALWKSEFGGDIYTYDGSLGCVNLPLDAAERIFHEVYTYYPVVVYSVQEWIDEGTYEPPKQETEKASERVSERSSEAPGESITEGVTEAVGLGNIAPRT